MARLQAKKAGGSHHTRFSRIIRHFRAMDVTAYT
jgi:hypothetical protein